MGRAKRVRKARRIYKRNFAIAQHFREISEAAERCLAAFRRLFPTLGSWLQAIKDCYEQNQSR